MLISAVSYKSFYTDTLLDDAMKKIVISARTKGLIFDCDGTLADTMPLHFEAYKRALGDDARYFSEEMFFDQAGVPAPKVMGMLKKKFDLDFDPDDVAHRKEKLYGEMLEHIHPVKAVADLVHEYSGKLPMAVASGGTRENVLKTLRLIGLMDQFQAIVSADEIREGKPAPDMFVEAARRLAVTPEDCTVLEDGEMGFAAAEAAGMNWIDVRPYYDSEKV